MVVTLPSEVTVLTLDGAFADCAGQGNLKSTLVCKPINKQIVIALEFSSSLKELSSEKFLEFEHLYDSVNVEEKDQILQLFDFMNSQIKNKARDADKVEMGA